MANAIFTAQSHHDVPERAAKVVAERDSLQAENQQLRTALERAATGLESVLAGRPVRDADEILAARAAALAAPTVHAGEC